MARCSVTVQTAYPGDVVGLVNPGQFAIGDTVYAGRQVTFPPLPHFPAESFAVLRLEDVRFKQFAEGLRQLEEEGLMQVLFPEDGRHEPIVGVVGILQFDVIVARLKNEYGVTARVDPLPYRALRWVTGTREPPLAIPFGAQLARDRRERQVLLLPSAAALAYAERENPGVQFRSLRSGTAAVDANDKRVLKEKLEQRLGELREALTRASETSAVAPDNAIGRLTRIDAMQAGFMSEALRREQTQELARAERALRAIDSEDYGRCRRCDEPLPLPRLLAKPDAVLCLSCAAASERR